jgi:hypothetical protein
MRRRPDIAERPATLTRRIAFTAAVTLALTALALCATWLAATVAYSLRPATCVADGCFCEATADALIAQPVDAITSLAFVVLGAWTLGARRGMPGRGIREHRLVPIAAVILIAIGLGSFFYHATLSYLGQFLDVLGMYLFGTFLILGALYRSGKISFRLATVTFLAANLVLAVVQYAVPDARRTLFGLMLIPGLVLESVRSTTGPGGSGWRLRYLAPALGLVVVAFAFWLLDESGLVCDPDSGFQGHGLWHVLTAIAAYLLVVHYAHTPHSEDGTTTEFTPTG